MWGQRLNLWMTNPIMREVMLCPGLGEMVTTLASEHMPTIEGMRIWHDQTLIKEPWGNATAWHIGETPHLPCPTRRS